MLQKFLWHWKQGNLSEYAILQRSMEIFLSDIPALCNPVNNLLFVVHQRIRPSSKSLVTSKMPLLYITGLCGQVTPSVACMTSYCALKICDRGILTYFLECKADHVNVLLTTLCRLSAAPSLLMFHRMSHQTVVWNRSHHEAQLHLHLKHYLLMKRFPVP